MHRVPVFNPRILVGVNCMVSSFDPKDVDIGNMKTIRSYLAPDFKIVLVVVVVSQFNGTSTPKGSYSAKTGDNDCNVNTSRYSLSTALYESNSLSGQVGTKCPTRPDTQGAPRGGCSHAPQDSAGYKKLVNDEWNGGVGSGVNKEWKRWGTRSCQFLAHNNFQIF